MKVLLDTCALIWWTLDQEKLPTSTLETINKSELYLSSISIWEVGIKIKNQKLDIGMSIEHYLEKLKDLSILQIIPVNEVIWLKNLNLKWEHKDPADRTIVATASLYQCWLATTDKLMTSYYKKILW